MSSVTESNKRIAKNTFFFIYKNFYYYVCDTIY